MAACVRVHSIDRVNVEVMEQLQKSFFILLILLSEVL